MTDPNRKYAWYNIKSAIRAYAKDPTDQHAQRVEDAWREIRRTETVSHWREWQSARLNAGDGSNRSGRVH
jgi:hypothetical protein